jgi:hypothetical protein
MSKPTYAHFAGGGPAGETCMTCGHRGSKEFQGRASHWCNKAAAFSQVAPSRDTPPRKLGRLTPHTAACKYWEERSETP